MKLPILFASLFAVFVAPVLADENIKLVERKTCEQIKTEIASLSALGNLNEEQQVELKQLTAQQRANCGIKSSGRRTIQRVQLNVPDSGMSPTAAPNVSSDALTEYMNNKQSNCEKLKAEAEKLATDSSKAYLMTEMQRIYDMDCIAQKAPTPEAAAPAENMPPVKTDEEWAAEYDANLAAGLCGDGTKPNKYGCCPDETFKDLGDSVFACCPNSGDYMCFPPITKAE